MARFRYGITEMSCSRYLQFMVNVAPEEGHTHAYMQNMNNQSMQSESACMQNMNDQSMQSESTRSN